MSRLARPSRNAAPVAVAIGILGIWWLVAHNGGSGWVQALGDVVFGTLFIGIFGPSVVLTCAKVRIVSAPVDGTAGIPTDVRIDASTRLRICARDPFEAEAFVGPVGRRHAPENIVPLLPERRGIHDSVTLDIATAAPFALQWWTRRVVLPLPSTLHVAPRSGRPESFPLRTDEDTGVSVDWVQTDVGQPRGARPYQPGDSRRRVHWSATAHAGELMVRELERPSAEPITLTVILPQDPQEAERVAERALGTIARFLERGTTVLLATVELSGPVVASVADRRGAGRRLARATSSAGASAVTGSP
jgi:uncharacterized protein (DUF58 family)